MKLYALHDKKAEALSAFHVEKSDAVATRRFVQAVLEPKSVLGEFADDFELVAVATVEEEAFAHGVVCAGFPFLVVVTARQVLDTRGPDGPALLREA